MRSTLALLLLFGAGIGVIATDTCKVYELPKDGTCEIVIEYRARDHDQALATCLEYFPTTFVKGEQTAAGTTKCIVTAAYQCVDTETDPDKKMFLIFDKCYRFPKDPTSGEYVKGTIADYQNQKLCNGGKLSVFYSYTHAKFVGMEAHRRNIDKLWIGIDKEGKELEGEKLMMHPNMWKLVEDDYWDGEELKKIEIPKIEKNGKMVHNVAHNNFPNYYFMRTRTDYVYNRWQGHFERASANMKATFACEFDSAYTANQAWYCNKLPILGLDAVYDDGKPTKPDESVLPARCLYVSANEYTFKGDTKDAAVADMKNIKGCQERPTNYLHSAGMDDGSARKNVYETGLKYKDKLRISGHIIEQMFRGSTNRLNAYYKQDKCTTTGVISGTTRKYLTKKWEYVNHHGISERNPLMPWDPYYPKNECSDFPGTSTTVGLKGGKQIDMPPAARTPAVCSLMFFQECENTNPNPCGKQLCINKDSFQENTGSATKPTGFFKCYCPGEDTPAKKYPLQPYKKVVGQNTCEWSGGDEYCAWLHFHGDDELYLPKNVDRCFITDDIQSNRISKWYYLNDRLDRVVVRDGCKLTVWSGAKGYEHTFELLKDLEYGSYHVPNDQDGSLPSEWSGDAASRVACTCNV